MSNDIRVRWAPSNTGADVHVGNVRTILFNHLFAKKIGGTRVFRIEDSDLARSKTEYADNIAATLDWLGLRADEGYKIGGDYGPYTQQEKLTRYKQVADQLIEQGHAYRCYCEPTELEALRNALPEKERHTFRYPGICRDRKDWPNDKRYVVRLKAPTEGVVEWDDIVFGHLVIPNKENYDWVLMRSDGGILYNFGCSVDDHDQKITHVIRGRDHTLNTPCQKILHQLLGSQDITYCHLPMLLGQDGAKLSKRHASVSISEYRNAGYTPSGILNYLLRFGFGYGNQEIFSMDEMIDKFDLSTCGKNDGKFDPKKFGVIQFEHLKTPSLTPDLHYAQHLSTHINHPPETLLPLIPLVRTRSKTLLEAANELTPILSPTITLDPIASAKLLTPEARKNLSVVHSFLSAQEDWRESSLSSAVQNWILTLNDPSLTIKTFGQPLRVSLTGRSQSPDIFQVIAALGKEQSLSRIAAQMAK
jgi:glutamyl-tRNA synthetase